MESAQVRSRPLRLAFLVEPRDRKALQRVFEMIAVSIVRTAYREGFASTLNRNWPHKLAEAATTVSALIRLPGVQSGTKTTERRKFP
jgi:hypothetical protein